MKKSLILLLVAVASATATEFIGDSTYLHKPVDLPRNFCQGCRSMVSFVSSLNSTSSRRNEIKDVLKMYCEMYFPPSTDSRQGPCPIFVEGFYYVTDRMDPVSHCDEIGACGSSKSLAEIPPNGYQATPSLQDGIVCEVCEQAVVQLRTQLEDPRMVAYLHKRVRDLCDFLKVIDQDDFCRQTVDKYIDDLVDFVLHLDPLKYCRSIQLCNRNESLSEPTHRDLPSLGDFVDFGLESSVKIGSPVEPKSIDTIDAYMTNHNHGSQCLFCKTFVKEMFKFVHENRTQENVKYGLDKICQVVYRRGSKLERCEQLVAAYSRELIDLLVDETNPELICMLLDQCTFHQQPEEISPKSSQQPEMSEIESSATPTMTDFMAALDPSLKKESVRTCIECKLFIKYLRNTIGNPNSELRVKEYLLKSLCARIEDKSVAKQCNVIVEQYADIFFRSVIDELNPRAACVDLGACNRYKMRTLLLGEDSPVAMDVASYAPQDNRDLKPYTLNRSPKEGTVPQTKDKMFCPQCIDIVTQIDEYLSTHPIDHDVSTLIEQVCNKLANEMAKQECTMLVNTFGQDIAQAIATMQNPRQLCTSISLC